jgi:hypothetical protein
MAITAAGLAALALVDARSALSRCGTIQALLGTANANPTLAAAATVLRIFLHEAPTVEAGDYIILTCKPRPSEHIADGLTKYAYDIVAECWLSIPSETTSPEQDFTTSHNLDQAVTELRAQDRAGTLDFHLADCATDQPIRDDDTGAAAGQVGNLLTMTLEAYDV